jgi:acetyl esterase/lipase
VIISRNRNSLLSCGVKIFLLFTFIACAVTISGRADNPSTMDIHRNLTYATPDGIPLTLDLYLPKNAIRPPPMVIWIHGGGWEAGSKENGCPVALARAGFAGASINYRLSEQAIFPAQIYDCKAAVRWVRAHAAKYGYNADKIGVVGASAGGHLVALLGTTNGEPQFEGTEGNTGVSSSVQAVVDYFGPSDFISIVQDATPEQRANLNNPVVRLLGGPVAEHEDLARMASPVFQISKQTCPFLIIQGDQDRIVPPAQSVELNDALNKAGISSRLILVKGAGHGFNDPASATAAAEFLKQQLGAP